METQMKAARLHAIGDFRTDEIPVPQPAGKQLLVKVSACGVCGSDIPRIHTLGTSKQKYPLTIGHEFGGEIVAAGPEAEPGLIGKTGAVFPIIPCRKCGPCSVGNYAMCEDYDYLGSRSDGGFAQYCLIPGSWHFVESHNRQLDQDALALIEPCTVAQHAIRRGGVTAGQHVVIFGAGPIGIMAGRWARLFGADALLVDVAEEKVRFAREKGMNCVNSMTENVTEALKAWTGGRLADVVIEGTGVGAALGSCLELCRPSGTVVMMGNPTRDTTIRLAQHSAILRKELTIRGIWNSYYADVPLNEWRCTMAKVDSGAMQVLDLITHRADLDSLPSLCRAIFEKKISICKAIYSVKA